MKKEQLEPNQKLSSDLLLWIKYFLQNKVELQKVHKDIALRVRALMLLDVEFVACGNTMKTKKIKEEELIEETVIVTAGIVEIIERVKEGWVNIVP